MPSFPRQCEASSVKLVMRRIRDQAAEPWLNRFWLAGLHVKFQRTYRSYGCFHTWGVHPNGWFTMGDFS